MKDRELFLDYKDDIATIETDGKLLDITIDIDDRENGTGRICLDKTYLKSFIELLKAKYKEMR